MFTTGKHRADVMHELPCQRLLLTSRGYELHSVPHWYRRRCRHLRSLYHRWQLPYVFFPSALSSAQPAHLPYSGCRRRRRLPSRARAPPWPRPACMPQRLPKLPRLRHDAAPARIPEGVRECRSAARPRELRRVRRARLAFRRTYRWGRPGLQRDSSYRWGEVPERCLCHRCVTTWIIRGSGC